MKKTLSLILALTLAMALAVPAMAAEVKSNAVTYTLSNETVGTMTIVWPEAQWDVLDENGWPVYADEPHTVYLVPAGTVVTSKDNFLDSSVYYLDKSTGEYQGAPGESYVESVTIYTVDKYGELVLLADLGDQYSDIVYFIKAVDAGDAGIYLKVADSSATPVPAPSTNTPASETPADSAPAATAPAETPAPAPAPAPSAPAGSGSYTAQKYDTYGKLAVNYYGSYAYPTALQKANDYKTLKEGVAVVLPDKLGDAVRLAPAAAGTGETLYTVLAGDTLGSIAQAHYGSSAKYKAIFERNADRLKNANTIYEGQVIVLPAK